MQELTHLRSLKYSTSYHSPTWTSDGISLIVMPAEESVQKREGIGEVEELHGCRIVSIFE
jgi:hypothetical protein